MTRDEALRQIEEFVKRFPCLLIKHWYDGSMSVHNNKLVSVTYNATNGNLECWNGLHWDECADLAQYSYSEEKMFKTPTYLVMEPSSTWATAATTKPIIDDLNGKCDRCGSRAYVGFTSVDCPKCGRY